MSISKLPWAYSLKLTNIDAVWNNVDRFNANIVAAKRGLTVVEHKEDTCENYASTITVEVTTNTGSTAVATTVMRGEIHIVRVNNYWIDIVPTGEYFLFCDHLDRPGLIGDVGSITGAANINISNMHVGRLQPRGKAMMILALDEPVPEKNQQELLSINGMYSAKLVKL